MYKGHKLGFVFVPHPRSGLQGASFKLRMTPVEVQKVLLYMTKGLCHHLCSPLAFCSLQELALLLQQRHLRLPDSEHSSLAPKSLALNMSNPLGTLGLLPLEIREEFYENLTPHDHNIEDIGPLPRERRQVRRRQQ